MGIPEIIKKIKVFLSEENEILSTDFKTVDGIIISIDDPELKTGIPVFIVDESGRNEAPDGEFILEDGTKITVVSGVIESITAPEEPVEPAEPVETPVEEPVEDMKVKNLQEKLEKLESQFVEMQNILSELAKNLGSKELESEIKTEMKKVEMSKIEKPTMEKNGNSVLDNIFSNMYKKI